MKNTTNKFTQNLTTKPYLLATIICVCWKGIWHPEMPWLVALSPITVMGFVLLIKVAIRQIMEKWA